jgi:ABC-type Fe3+/spermidine/putrescine transport system ATPase subunit
MIRVNLDSLLKHYDRVAVVDNASLELAAGEMTVVLGPAGAGKTTLARLIAGLESLDDGEIYFDSRLVHRLPAHERRVGMVFQDDALWPRLTVAENVAYSLKVQKVPRGERRDRVGEALNLQRIDTLAGKLPEELTPLQRRRVALARALAGRPELLILDEPLGRLEPRARDEFRQDCRRTLAEGGVTTLLLTNDTRAALALADRLAVMDLGRIIQVGVPDDVYRRPIDAFVARLLGQTNLVQGHIDGASSRGEVIVRTPFGRMIGHSSTGAHAAGTPVTLSIRPESLLIGPTVPPGSNRFPATVERLVFLGAVRQVHLRGPGDWPAVAVALQSQSQSLREGQSLTVSVAPEHVVVLIGRYPAGR